MHKLHSNLAQLMQFSLKTSNWATIYHIYEDHLFWKEKKLDVQSADVACFASLDAMVAGAFIIASSKAW